METDFQKIVNAANAAMTTTVQNVEPAVPSDKEQIAVLTKIVADLIAAKLATSHIVASQPSANLPPVIFAPKMQRVFPYAYKGKVMASVTMTPQPEGTYTHTSYFFTANQVKNLWKDFQTNQTLFGENLRIAAAESAPYVVMKDQ